jgi:hypothetical protein
MLRKISFALVTAAALGTVALAPTSASAWGRGGGFHDGWHGNSYNSYGYDSYDSYDSYDGHDRYDFRGHDRRR